MAATRYNSVAISLHWLIAMLLIGLVVLAKFMNTLEETDPFRFELIQWHKSFGILALLLVIFRVLWRLTHRPPALPLKMKALERYAAGGAHLVLYFLMLMIPLTGWVMVSASPLNLKTELFGLLPWPHLPVVADLPNKGEIAEQFVNYHHWLGHGLMIVVIIHIAAALRHHFFVKDDVMSRMFISATAHGNDNRQGLLPGLLLACAGSLFLVNQVELNGAAIVSSKGEASGSADQGQSVAFDSSVGFTALQLGEKVNGVFEVNEIVLRLDDANVAASTLNATVETASINTGDSQIDATVVTADWFASTQFPDATFASSRIEMQGGDSYNVTGILNIRAIEQAITFPMQLIDGVARGEFSIDRTRFEVGSGGQDEFIDPLVTIRFRVKAQ